MTVMNNKKFRPIIVVAALVGAGGLVGCKSQTPPPDTSTTAPVASAPVAPTPMHRKMSAKQAKMMMAAKLARAAKLAKARKLAMSKTPAKATPKVAAKPASSSTTSGERVANTASVSPLAQIESGPDPFRLPNSPPKPPRIHPQPVVPLPDIPDDLVATWRDVAPPPPPPDTFKQVNANASDNGVHQMQGVLFGNGVYAILATNGKAEAVQPGDTVEGGTVVSISADGLVLKRDDGSLVPIPLAGTTDNSK
ncbi:MAG: hypothetical protein ACLQVD_12150 [Capsulimonadaceae bacterium]